MLVDALSLRAGATFTTDVCVVGAGAAGITLARELGAAKLDVCLLESGGFEPEAAVQALAAGEVESDARRMTSAYASTSRLRQFGGSTNHWAGQCRPLDALDFEVRPWIERSGWPFPRAALDPFYERARRLVEAPPLPDGVGRDEPGGAALAFPREHTHVVAKPFAQTPLRFGVVFRDELVSAPTVTLMLHAHAVEIETSASGAAAVGVRGVSQAGRPFRVVARRVVLAAGAIENARLLLASRRARPAGLGNDADLVGRTFMDHPHGLDDIGLAGLWSPTAARVYLPDALTLFFASAALQRTRRIGAVAVNLLVGPAKLPETARTLLASAQNLDLGPEHNGAPLLASLLFRAEHTPNPESRVTLLPDADRLGVPRVKVAWRLGPGDLDSITTFLDVFARELAAAGVGRLRIDATRERLPDLLAWGNHHMGTTRMASDPRHGVTDAHGGVHGVAGLFVAGSSLFPTSGAVNPTFTILALALRLADHLRAPEGP